MICFPYEKLDKNWFPYFTYVGWVGALAFVARRSNRCASKVPGGNRTAGLLVPMGFLETASYEGMSVKQATYLKNGCFSGIISNCLVLEKPNLMHMYG